MWVSYAEKYIEIRETNDKTFLCVFVLFPRCNYFSLFCIKVGIGYWSPPIRALLRVCCGMFSGIQKVLDAPLCYRV
jgi:hypothetical protein